ncbi:MAG: SDR family oxidoreductase [Solibacillus sp.]
MKKFALVCGATGAIGSAIAERLASDGWSLYLQYYANEQKVQQLVSMFQAQYPEQEFLAVQVDFSEQLAAEQLAAQLFSLQAIVFAGGHAHYGLLEDTAASDMQRLWQVHVQTPMQLLALVARKLRQQQTSYVLFIGSIWGSAGAAGEVAYSAVKGAQHSFVKAYAQEVAYNGIRVNVIAPGFIDTSMNGQLNEEEREMIQAEIPLQRFGQVAEVANMTSFYLSGQADYVTGQILHLNGGWYI